jgi:hypothetical protein
VNSVSGCIRAYGGERKMAEAFQTTVEGVRQWKRWGEVPCTEHLGLFLGLMQLGYQPGPKLFDVKSLDELPGV